MAHSLHNFSTILSILIPLLLLLFTLRLHAQITLSTDIEDVEDYVLDTPLPNFGSRSRFLASTNVIKKNARCHANADNICNGVVANNGTSLLYCCQSRCKNVLGDQNHCGKCGNKCQFGQLCCGGTCVNALSDSNHCGKCSRQCAPGVKCEFGSCGYA